MGRTAMTSTWLMRWLTAPLTGGRASPWVDELLSLDERWRLTVKNRAPEGVSQAATSGLRLAFHAAFDGSIRPGLNLVRNRGVREHSGAARGVVRKGERT